MGQVTCFKRELEVNTLFIVAENKLHLVFAKKKNCVSNLVFRSQAAM